MVESSGGKTGEARGGGTGKWVPLFLLAICGAACSTSYQPAPTARVSTVIHRGAAMYVGDGHEVHMGPFSSSLEALVESTPEAAAHARKAHTQLTIGVPIYSVGVAAVATGMLVLSGPIGWVIAGVGVASSVTGLGFMGKGFTHLVDALNIHNDAVSGTEACRQDHPKTRVASIASIADVDRRH
jgi:hypothetical protein